MRRATSFLYGLGEFGISALETFLRLQLILFYAKNVGLRMEWAALAVTLSLIGEAFIEPVIGDFSDRWKGKTGTRVPFLLLGAALTTVFVLILFHPPQVLLSEFAQAGFLFLMSFSTNLCLSFFAVPYAAMVGDFTTLPSERAVFIGWRSVFANLGTVTGILVPGIYLMADDPSAYQQSSWVLAIVILASAFLATLRTPVKTESLKTDLATSSFLLRLKNAIKHSSLRRLLLFSFMITFGLTIGVSSLLYFFRIRLELVETDIQSVLLTFYFLSSLCVPVWIVFGRNWGRVKVLRWGAFLLAAHALLVYPFLPTGNVMLAFVGAGLLGGFFIGSYVLAELVLTDVIDQASSRPDESSFGLYFGFWRFTNKIARTAGLVVVSYALTWANVNFPFPETAEKLTVIQGPVVGILLLLALVPSYFLSRSISKK